ncbi:CoA transferase [Pseudomonas asiatica]|uniref:CaiB/BaiF CoA transferase family protein n=1 Tax=Pseudomonas asiatica TaxID=2219225 RepID=UPI002E7B789F|nr:CoA transferase [Pseudomonas asiatica]MEE1916343.1 CoA transferase [Pseudomonas asiatica]
MVNAASTDPTLPLAGMRVIELADGKTDMAGRLLADLGAEVILLEPPQGSASRRIDPMFQGTSLYFATHHANKRSLVLDLKADADKAAFIRLLASTDLLLDASGPDNLARLGLPVADLRSRYPGLVVLSISDFGLTGPYSEFCASHAVHTALGGVLCRSGKPGHTPLLPPGNLCWESAAMQAVWVALLGQWQRLKTGCGDHLDFSIQEAIAQVLDPGLGVTGSAQAGKSALDSTSRDRPVAVPLYPILRCKDGFVRICALNPRQWEGLRDWLGPDHEFHDPQYLSIAKRMPKSAEINALTGELFARHTAAELLLAGQHYGVPIAIVSEPSQVLEDEHFAARRSFVPLQLSEGVRGQVPSGYLELDGRRAGIRHTAPRLGADTDALLNQTDAADKHAGSHEKPFLRRPLEGVRVLDLGVIVAGAEAGRLMADQGAEVIKVENRAFPDGGRQSMTGSPITPSIAQGHRNKRSLGINLRSETGRDLFKQLVAKSDVVLSNFKPGTLESLGLSYEVLKQVNPGIVVLDSSAMGNSGPQSRTPGYGPLVRAATGMTSLWRYPDMPEFFGDGVTIFPDHMAGRVAVVGVLALLLRRERTGLGGTVSVAQAEIFINGTSEQFLLESLQPGSFKAQGNHSAWQVPDGIFACAGDDQWCAVSVRDDDDWLRLLSAIGRRDLAGDSTLATAQGRLANREQVNALVAAWTAQRSPQSVTQTLQAAGVPAGFMLRLSDYRSDPHYAARDFIRELVHPGLPTPLPTENRIAHSLHMPEPPLDPAPLQAEHTRELAERLLGLARSDIEALINDGHLEDVAAAPAKA